MYHASSFLGFVAVGANHREALTKQEDDIEKIVVKRGTQQLDDATRARRCRKRAASEPSVPLGLLWLPSSLGGARQL